MPITGCVTDTQTLRQRFWGAGEGPALQADPPRAQLLWCQGLGDTQPLPSRSLAYLSPVTFPRHWDFRVSDGTCPPSRDLAPDAQWGSLARVSAHPWGAGLHPGPKCRGIRFGTGQAHTSQGAQGRQGLALGLAVPQQQGWGHEAPTCSGKHPKDGGCGRGRVTARAAQGEAGWRLYCTR